MIFQHDSPRPLGGSLDSPSIHELLGIRRRLATDQPLDAHIGGIQATAEAVQLGFRCLKRWGNTSSYVIYIYIYTYVWLYIYIYILTYDSII